MVHLTIALENEVLESARKKAHAQGTSLDDVVRHYLESYVSSDPEKHRRAIESLLDLSSKAKSGSGGRKWTREDLYDR
jgi:DNA-directed RNA polymerase subunit F